MAKSTSITWWPAQEQKSAVEVLNWHHQRGQAENFNWILDADIRNYFGDWALRFLGHRIADYKDARSHAEVATGVLEEGEWAASEEGTPQGASRSPLLANIYLHYTLDLWVQPWRKRPAAM